MVNPRSQRGPRSFPSKFWISRFSLLLFSFHLISFVSALPTTLVHRAPSDRIPADQQVYDVIKFFHEYKNSLVASPDTPLSEIESQIRNHLNDEDSSSSSKITLFYIEYLGTFGDVGTSMTVLKKLMELPNMYDVHLAVDPRAVEYLPDSIRTAFDSEIKKCQDDGFVSCVLNGFNDFKPRVIARGHPVYRFYGDDYDKIFKPAEDCLKEDECIVADIKSFFVDPTGYERWPMWVEYEISPNRFTLIGQQPELWGSPDPGITGQVLVGKYETQAVLKQAINPGVADFISKSKTNRKNIMYLGIGGLHREEEAPIDQALAPLRNFVDQKVKDVNNWNFLLFHNAAKPAGTPDPPITNDGRVYHVWFGENSYISMWADLQLVLHHCGAGSVSDAIVAGVPQVGMPIDPNVGPNRQGADGLVFADKIAELGIGERVQEISLYDIDGWPVDQLHRAFDKITTKDAYPKYRGAITGLSKVTKKLSGGPNAAEVIERATLGLLERMKARGDEQCEL